MLGRLGNNLFQYAFGRVLAERHQVPILMDASWFNERTWRYVSPLGRLPGFAKGLARITRPFSVGSRMLLKLTGKHHWQYLAVPVIGEIGSDHSYDARLLDAPGDCVLMGYFQSPLYFREVEQQLRSELSTHGLGLESGHEELAGNLGRPGSVAVHVRRTDYIQNRNLTSLGVSYYGAAMNQLRNEISGCRFHVFSDDPAWCRDKFRDPDTEVLTHSNPFDPLTDLHLMSLASHHVIANSSYSWWAAWLGKKPGQRVIMPDRWYERGIKAPIEEKCCEGWQIGVAG